MGGAEDEQNAKMPVALEYLDISTNSIGGGDGFCCFAEKLLANESLRSLRLSACGLGDEDTAMLAECMAQHPNLQVLHLASNSISALGSQVLADSFAKANVRLEELDLSGNPLCSEGAGTLLIGLKGNGTLRSLNLYDTNILDEGAAAIQKALRDESTAAALTNLNLARNA